MKIVKLIKYAFLSLFATACATSFTGSAHVENGRQGCEAKCKGQGMELVGMVYMGEYSDACVCAVPGQTGSMQKLRIASAGAVAAGAAGVVMQMRRQEEQRSHRY
jgi:hypothetical protein